MPRLTLWKTDIAVTDSAKVPTLRLLWAAPPDQWRLGAFDVHVWAARLDQPINRIASLAQTLSTDELYRAGTFQFERHRSRFIVGREILRAILSSYLETDPQKLVFAYGSHGKPYLTSQPEGQLLNFNLSHSNELAVLGLTRLPAIGVDVEWVHAIDDVDKPIQHFLSSRETRELAALPKEDRRSAFFNLWTRKEAWLKAKGTGLSDNLDEIEVSFLPEEPARLFACSGDRQAAACWSLVELRPAPEFKGAVVVESKSLQLSCWEWRL